MEVVKCVVREEWQDILAPILITTKFQPQWTCGSIADILVPLHGIDSVKSLIINCSSGVLSPPNWKDEFAKSKNGFLWNAYIVLGDTPTQQALDAFTSLQIQLFAKLFTLLPSSHCSLINFSEDLKQTRFCFLCETTTKCSNTSTTLCASSSGTVQYPRVSHFRQQSWSETRSKHWPLCRPRPHHPKHGTRHSNSLRTLAQSTTSLLLSMTTVQHQLFITTQFTRTFLNSLPCIFEQ